MTTARFYPLGTPGQPWGPAEKAEWRAQQPKRRSYEDEVVRAIDALRDRFDVTQYGELDYPPDGRYPLFAVRSRDWRDDLPCVLVTGGVHGYETSGVHGALRYLHMHAAGDAGRANLLVVPCVSPWAYERIHRWNAHAIDPNRSFRDDSPAEESAALLRLIEPAFTGALQRASLRARLPGAGSRAALELSPRELTVARMVSEGLTDKQIALHLGVELSTVRTYLKRTFMKLGVHRRGGLAAAIGRLRNN